MAKHPLANDDGECIRCDGTGHDQNNDGQLCRACSGAGRFDEDDDEDSEAEQLEVAHDDGFHYVTPHPQCPRCQAITAEG